jgi:hypothetical protein
MPSKPRTNLFISPVARLLLFLAILAPATPARAIAEPLTTQVHRDFPVPELTHALTLTQYGITWMFDKPVRFGQFTTGDYWVVGPITVVSVTPAPTKGRNGSVVNPKAGVPQAYDDRIFDYTANLAATFPLELKPNQSLVSTASVERIGQKTPDTIPGQYAQGPVRTAAVLTCLAEPPPPDAFRPPFVGDSKPLFRASELRRQILPRLRPPFPGGLPSRRVLERALQRIWLDHKTDWPSRAMHPLENMPDYGRDITNVVSDASLLLMLDEPGSENLLFHFVQLGIDNYATAISDPHVWAANGGHASGRKFPILFAGVLLGDPAMQHVTADFAEDQQTYYAAGYRGQKVLWKIDPTDDRKHEDLPPDQWRGSRFTGENDGFKSEAYRTLNGPTWVGEALTARLIGAKTLWNHDAFFDYVDRWVAEAKSGTVNPQTLKPQPYVAATPFTLAMWQAYRPKADQIAASAPRGDR